MFVFVVGDSLFSYFGGGRNARAGEDHDAKATAVHWDGGKLTNRQLNELVIAATNSQQFFKECGNGRPAALGDSRRRSARAPRAAPARPGNPAATS